MSHIISTYTGRLLDFDDPRNFDIQDIAHGLSQTCRFAAQTTTFYSVAQHSVLVSLIARDAGQPLDVQFACLMHDAQEAYMCDVPTPLKSLLPDYRKIEARVARAICEQFGVAWPLPSVVKVYDKRAYLAERAVFVTPVPEYPGQPLDGPAPVPWHSVLAKSAFLTKFEELHANI